MCAAANQQTHHAYYEKNSLRGAVVNGRRWQWYGGAIRKIGDAPFVDDVLMHVCRRRMHLRPHIPHQHGAGGDGRSRTRLTGAQIELTGSLGHVNRLHLHIKGIV